MSEQLKDGHATLITFAENGAIKLYEKTVTPPGVDGGGENDTTTMRNTNWRTRQPKALKTLTECQATCAYDPAVYDEVVAMVNVNQLITVTFSDESTVAFWGWLDKFTPGECAEGEQPEADVVIVPSNQDNDGNEIAPNYTAAA
jgi:hypothetical protein